MAERFSTLNPLRGDTILDKLGKLLELELGLKGGDGSGGGIIVQGSAASGKVSQLSFANTSSSGVGGTAVAIGTVSPLLTTKALVFNPSNNAAVVGISPDPTGAGYQNMAIPPGGFWELSNFGNVIDLSKIYVKSQSDFAYNVEYWTLPA